MLRILLIFLTATLCTIGMSIIGRRRARKNRKRDRAARILIQESLLKKALSSEELSRTKMMPILFIGWNESMYREIAFSGVEGVRIGRSLELNQIVCIQPDISWVHCCIYMSKGRIYVSDEGSSNGTYVKYGLSKHRINGIEEIHNHTYLYIGSVKLKVDAKVYDTAYL